MMMMMKMKMKMKIRRVRICLIKPRPALPLLALPKIPMKIMLKPVYTYFMRM
jgi:hypothetical protein